MKAFIYRAAMLCEPCGEQVISQLGGRANCPALVDSDKWPDGVYDDGGGEADSPQHCDACGVFLENPLTPDGAELLRDQATQYAGIAPDMSWAEIAEAARLDGKDALAEWLEYYFAPAM